MARQDGRSLFRVGPFQQQLAVRKRTGPRRKITPEAGRALEKLSHALEYLADEFAHGGCEVVRDYGRIQAIQLLASLNRQLYFSCEVVPTFRERVRSLFRRFSASST
jgi:hypothetical protein